jgi:hypothetical protein
LRTLSATAHPWVVTVVRLVLALRSIAAPEALGTIGLPDCP